MICCAANTGWKATVAPTVPHWSTAFCFLLLGLGLFHCQKRPPAYTQLEGNAQGTTFRIAYVDSLERDFSVPVDSIFRVIDRSMSLWDSTSVISLLNANHPGTRADAHFTKRLSKSLGSL